MTDKLMDTEPGGEQTQYEGLDTFTRPHDREEGTMAAPGPTEAQRQSAQESQNQGEGAAERIRYGPVISESGIGGKSAESKASKVDRGSGSQPLQDTREGNANAREAQ